MSRNDKAIEVTNNDPSKMSIFELVKQLEKKMITPESLSKNVLRKCADIYKGRGYSNTQIAEILEVDEKTVQRYIKQQREENSLTIGQDFQKNIVGEIIRNWKTQYQRLLKLSYSDDLVPNEIMKAIYFAHQVEKDGVELLERLGYLRKEKVPEVNSGWRAIVMVSPYEIDPEKDRLVQKLSNEDKEEACKMINERAMLSVKINKFMKEKTGEELFLFEKDKSIKN